MFPVLKMTEIAVKDLFFDHQNPRLAEYGVTPQTTEEEILTILWEASDVQELVQSISASGYFQQEALIVLNENGKNIVLEGNRRLAAVKLLIDVTLAVERGWKVPEIGHDARKLLEKLPVLLSTRQEAWRYLGFKHVNGPAKWSSFAKANYIAEVYRQYKIPMADIAYQIGDRHHTVQRLYRGLMVLEQAEREKVYDRDDRFRQRLAFSHLYTGLDYEGISSFLDLKSKDEATDTPVPPEKVKELGELCVWLYGSKKENKPPVVESQNPDLRELDSVLKDRQALAALRAGNELSKAFEISKPAPVVFESALLAAKRELTTARAYLTDGYDKSEALLRVAGSIAEMADDIYSEMDRKRKPGKKTRLTEN